MSAGLNNANFAASWISAIATSIGLTTIMTQIATIRDQLDPFLLLRDKGHLGTWADIQETQSWYSLARPPPQGPVIEANLETTLTVKTISLSRKPAYDTGAASWTIFLAVFHPVNLVALEEHRSFSIQIGNVEEETLPHHLHRPHPRHNPIGRLSKPRAWIQLLKGPNLKSLIRHRDRACTTISKITLISFLLLSQARELYRHEAAGLRLTFAGYNGVYQIEWPLAEVSVLTFEAHQSHAKDKDVFPEYFIRRPDKCVEMGVGIINIGPADKERRIAFSGRKGPGRWLLKLWPRGFGARRTGTDLYSKMSGEVEAVDFLAREPLDDNVGAVDSSRPLPPHQLKLNVASTKAEERATLLLDQQTVELMAECLDCLPWSSLAWSIHRGLKDTIVAYGLAVAKRYQAALGDTLHGVVMENEDQFIEDGWAEKFVREHMAEATRSAALSGSLCSGDSCRIISAVARRAWLNGGGQETAMDQTKFWKDNIGVQSMKKVVPKKLQPDTIVALVKFLFVRWSHDFDYGIYHILPSELMFI